jgi:dihydrofolate reductase
VDEALSEAEGYPRVLVIGGERGYREMLPHIERIFVTKIDCVPHSDAFFPDLDADEAWRIADPGEEKEQDGLKYRFMVYERK